MLCASQFVRHVGRFQANCCLGDLGKILAALAVERGERRIFVGTVTPILRPRFEVGWRRGSVCVQIRLVVVRG